MKLPIAILNKQEMPFLKNGEQEGKTGPVWVLVPVGGKMIQGKGIGGVNEVEI
jgi:hypothetical protein